MYLCTNENSLGLAKELLQLPPQLHESLILMRTSEKDIF